MKNYQAQFVLSPHAAEVLLFINKHAFGLVRRIKGYTYKEEIPTKAVIKKGFETT